MNGRMTTKPHGRTTCWPWEAEKRCCCSTAWRLPSGKVTKSYWTWPFIVDLPINYGDFPVRYVSLSEGNSLLSWFRTNITRVSDRSSKSTGFCKPTKKKGHPHRNPHDGHSWDIITGMVNSRNSKCFFCQPQYGETMEIYIYMYIYICIYIYAYIYILVGGLEHDIYFSIYWEFHHPNWLSHFSEGLKPPTS